MRFNMVFTPVTDHTIAANTVLSNSEMLWRQMKDTYMHSYDLVWNNPVSPPAEVISAMGTQAAKIFQHSAIIGQLLAADGATYGPKGNRKPVPATIPNGYAATANPDGTVTITGSPV